MRGPYTLVHNQILAQLEERADESLADESLADDPAAVERACIRQHGAEAWARWTDSAKSYRSVLLGEMAEVLRAAETGEQ